MRRQFQDLKFDLIQKGEIFYEGETQGGDSGSPIFLIQSDDKLQGYLIGIHTAKLNQTSYDKQRKKGAFFNADNVNKVNYHIQKLKAQNFVYETSHQLEKLSEQMQDSLLDYNQFSLSEYANKIASFMNNAAVVFKTVNEKLIGQTSFNKTMKYFNQTLQTFMNNLCNKINNIKNMYDQNFLEIRKLLFEASNISIDATLSKIYENKKDIQDQRPIQLPKNASWDQLLLSSSSIISDKKDSQIYD